MTNTYPIRKDTIGRRSRFHRQPTGKRIQLTKRDLEIFRLLWRYRYLRSDRIVDYFAPKSPKRLTERLGDLYHETTLISRPRAQWSEFRAEQKPIAYELTKSGLDTLFTAQSAVVLPYPIVSFGGSTDRTVLQFHHALQISETLFDIETRLSAKQIVSLNHHSGDEANSHRVNFICEREILNQVSPKIDRQIQRMEFSVAIPKSRYVPFQKVAFQTRIIPDAFFAVAQLQDGQSLYRFYALEVERKNPLKRSSLEKPSSLKKLLAYQALHRTNGAQTQLTLPNLFLIIAAETETQLLAIIEMAHHIWNKQERQFILFAPPPSSKSWRHWLKENESFLQADQTLLFMEIAQKWSKHFEP